MAVTGSLFRVASLLTWKVSHSFLMRHFEKKKSPVLMQIAMRVIGTSKQKESVKFTKIKRLTTFFDSEPQ